MNYLFHFGIFISIAIIDYTFNLIKFFRTFVFSHMSVSCLRRADPFTHASVHKLRPFNTMQHDHILRITTKFVGIF